MSKVRVFGLHTEGRIHPHIRTGKPQQLGGENSGSHLSIGRFTTSRDAPADPNRLYVSQSSGWFGGFLQCLGLSRRKDLASTRKILPVTLVPTGTVQQRATATNLFMMRPPKLVSR